MTKTEQTALADAQALISGLELPYLVSLQGFLADEIKKRQSQARTDALLQIQKILAEANMTAQELLQGVSGKKGVPRVNGPVAPKYQHPVDASLLWSGRGQSPKWVKDWTTQHGSMDGILIKQAA